jgi:competence protein ComEA
MLQSFCRSFVRWVLLTSVFWGSASFAVNRASEAELDGIRGLGPNSTARILKARESGPFKSWADLMARVKGIKPATATKLSVAGMTVGDAPYPTTGDR